MNYIMDQKFKDYYQGNLKQVFLYLIDDCNLRCVQCLYKLDICFQVEKKEIAFEDAVKLISDFRELGAVKLTLMGGEPTLYGKKDGNRQLLDLIKKAKELGYEYVRIDTNGQFDSKLLEEPEFKMLDEITFSIDGPNSEINDKIRGKGSFEKAIKNLKRAKELGYNIDITACISKELIKRDENGDLYIDKMIKLAEELGIEKMNFHNLFKTGIPRDHFTGNIDITIKDWFEVKDELERKIENNEYSIPVRIPASFTTKERFQRNPEYYGYCTCKTKSALLVHPNGMLRVCPLLIGTGYGIGKYYDGKIEWDNSPTNELRGIEMDKNTPCATQFKHNKFGKYVPVCCSFKPKQNEKIWQELDWESKTTGDKIRTIIADNDKEDKEKIVDILGKRDDVEVVAVAESAIDTYNKIVELKPEMVFVKYDFGTDMNGLDIIRKSKETLNEDAPVFNLIASTIPEKEFTETFKIAEGKMNSIIKENTEERYNGIIEDYKEYLNEFTKL